jgi:hypothetical protein
MRRALLLAWLVLLPLLARAQMPGGEERTRAQMQALCTELNLPCNSCGGHKTDPAVPKPTPRPANDLLRHPVDGWGRPLQISVGAEGVVLRSAGSDGELGTADDLVQSCGKTVESK